MTSRRSLLPRWRPGAALDHPQSFLQVRDGCAILCRQGLRGRRCHGHPVLPRRRLRRGCRGSELLQGRPLLRERAREIEARQASLVDEDLPDPCTCLALHVERGIELIAADEPELDEDLADRPPDLHLAGGHWGDGRLLLRGNAVALRVFELGPLLGEHARKLEPRDAELCHDDLAEPVAAVCLQLQRPLELLVRDHVLLDENGADQARLDRSGCFHSTPIGSHSFEV